MSRATPKIREFAERLIAFETTGKKASGTKLPPAFRVCENLRPHLATLMGKGGFRALFSRALALASADVLWLSALSVNADGSLAGPDDIPSQVDPKERTEGGVLLVAQLLGLLVAFIGEDLTVRLVREAWPKLSLNELNFGDKK